MVPHFGTKDSRVHAEVRELGAELKKLQPLLGARVQARVALVVSWENRWALELESKPTQFNYTRIVLAFYRVFWELNIPVDIVHPNQPLAGYDVVAAPALYQLSKNQSESLRAFVTGGGTLLMSYFSGVADENEHIWLGGYPALLQDVLGLAIEEWQPLTSSANQSLQVKGEPTAIPCSEMCELMQLRGATALATYTNDFYAGHAALTTHAFGQGHAHYLATLPAHDYLMRWFRSILDSQGITAPLPTPQGVEATVRVGTGEEFLFVINHEPKAVTIDFSAWSGRDLITGESTTGVNTLTPFGVRVVSRPRQPTGKKFNPVRSS
jgi:beta-galactosidase